VRDAAIDVWSAEGARANPTVARLRAHPSIIATSHIGSHTHGVMERYAMQCARNIAAVVEGRTEDIARFVVRPEH
jgi:phosphoglycerate dehydrogenase-like enzyme